MKEAESLALFGLGVDQAVRCNAAEICIYAETTTTALLATGYQIVDFVQRGHWLALFQSRSRFV